MNATESSVSVDASPSPGRGPDSGKPRIFVVEDSPTQARKLKFALLGNGFDVLVVHSGEEALARIPGFRPDIIVSDIVMPGIDGYELCRRTKRIPTMIDVPFMLLTSLEEPGDVLNGLQCGAEQFLTKPWNEEFLISRLRFILKTRDLRRDHRLSEDGMYVAFGGEIFPIAADREQILDLLLSTYENAVQKTRELRETNERLRDALETINTMGDLVPICSMCQKIRDDSGFWAKIEEFLTRHSVAQFSHSYCPDCSRKALEDSGMEPDEDISCAETG